MCYRCHTQCGNAAKQCRLPISALSNSSVVGLYIRVAIRSKKDIRNEKEEAERELEKRGFVLPRTVQEGKEMRLVFQDLERGTPIIFLRSTGCFTGSKYEGKERVAVTGTASCKVKMSAKGLAALSQ